MSGPSGEDAGAIHELAWLHIRDQWGYCTT
jgi:hypothetical protein